MLRTRTRTWQDFTYDRVGVFEIKPDRPLFTFVVLTSPAIAVYISRSRQCEVGR